MNAFYWMISLKCFTLLYCYGKLLYSFYSYMYILSLLQTPIRCLRFFVLCNCHIHVSRCLFSDIIYRKTKSKLFISKMLKDTYYLVNSYKNFPFLVLRKIKNDFRFGSNINFTAGWPQTYNVQLIKAGVCRLNKITLYKV